MMPLDEKDLQLLAEVLPNVSAQLRSSMANVFAAANRLAPAEAREADPMLDKNAAILTMSCHQMLRLVGNLSAASELLSSASATRSASVPSRFSRCAASRCAFPPATRATSSHSTPPCSSARF